MTKCPGKSKRSKGESLGPAAPAWDKERLSLLSAKKQNKREKHRMRSCSVLVTFSRGQTVIAPHANSGHWRHDSPASRISTPSARRLTEPRSPITAQPHHVTLPRCPAEPPKASGAGESWRNQLGPSRTVLSSPQGRSWSVPVRRNNMSTCLGTQEEIRAGNREVGDGG